MFCKHNWENINKHIFKPPVQVAKENGIKTSLGAAGLHEQGVLIQKVTWIFKCTKCSKLKVISRCV